jgi:hypothetical protein
VPIQRRIEGVPPLVAAQEFHQTFKGIAARHGSRSPRIRNHATEYSSADQSVVSGPGDLPSRIASRIPRIAMALKTSESYGDSALYCLSLAARDATAIKCTVTVTF